MAMMAWHYNKDLEEILLTNWQYPFFVCDNILNTFNMYKCLSYSYTRHIQQNPQVTSKSKLSRMQLSIAIHKYHLVGNNRKIEVTALANLKYRDYNKK